MAPPPDCCSISTGVVNDEIGVGVLESSEPYQRIPAECFTQPINCDQANADNKCCMYVEPTR